MTRSPNPSGPSSATGPRKRAVPSASSPPPSKRPNNGGGGGGGGGDKKLTPKMAGEKYDDPSIEDVDEMLKPPCAPCVERIGKKAGLICVWAPNGSATCTGCHNAKVKCEKIHGIDAQRAARDLQAASLSVLHGDDKPSNWASLFNKAKRQLKVRRLALSDRDSRGVPNTISADLQILDLLAKINRGINKMISNQEELYDYLTGSGTSPE